jgi:hypothetical protein
MNEHIKVLKGISKSSLVLIISNLLEESFQKEVIDTQMYPLIIGVDGTYLNKEEWILEKLNESLCSEIEVK